MIERPKDPEPKPGVIVGDEVFVRHPRGDCSARVVATGKHGITATIGGKPHRVKWENVLGHKARTALHYNIVERGEDGHLVEDAGGARRFINIPNEAKADPLIVKALPKDRGLKAGKSVSFRLGEKDGEGTIIGRPGAHGAHVRDASGAVHLIRWHEMKPTKKRVVK